VWAWQAPAFGVRHARQRAASLVVLVVAALTIGLIAVVTAVAAAVPESVPHDEDAAQRSRPVATVPSRSPAAPSGQHAAPSAVPRGEPTRVLIPAIEVDAALVPLGLRPDRAMEVPAFGLAGWYARGPRPGHPGPAVLAAHVDSRVGPDVFFRLRDLVVGDLVHVIYDSGDRVTFVVTWSEQTPKEALPVASIWPLTGDRLLALITCGGTFDRDARSYRDNVVVYTTPLGLVAPGGTVAGSSGTR
jgi:sortase (surface protein transpeptidase)